MNELNSVNINDCFKKLDALTDAAAKFRELGKQTEDAKKSLKQLKKFFDNMDLLVRNPEMIPQELHQRYELIGFGMCSMERPSTVIIQLPNP